MRHFLLRLSILVLLCITISAVPAFAAVKTVKLSIPDMCASNEIQAQSVLEELDGVTSVKTDLDDMYAVVTFDDEVTEVDAFKKALNSVSLIIESVEVIK